MLRSEKNLRWANLKELLDKDLEKIAGGDVDDEFFEDFLSEFARAFRDAPSLVFVDKEACMCFLGSKGYGSGPAQDDLRRRLNGRLSTIRPTRRSTRFDELVWKEAKNFADELARS